MSANHTVREYDGTTATYTARRDIPALWMDRIGWWRRQWEAFKTWQYGEAQR